MRSRPRHRLLSKHRLQIVLVSATAPIASRLSAGRKTAGWFDVVVARKPLFVETQNPVEGFKGSVLFMCTLAKQNGELAPKM